MTPRFRPPSLGSSSWPGGWELLELSTPGMFDVEIVRRAVEANPSGEWPRVLRALVLDADAVSQ